MKIVLFGVSGTLGKELKKLNPELICPTHSHVDITLGGRVMEYIRMHKPDVVINAAAILNNSPSEKAIDVNIVGAANLAMACIKNKARLVYISSDYVYKGDRGNYSEEDELLPFNFYAWTKLGGECSAKGVENHLIIRTSFGASEFPYPQAFSDKFSSKDYVDVIAPLILEAALSDLTGVLNIGTDKKTLYEYAKKRTPNVFSIEISQSPFSSPLDTSLNLQKWTDYKTNSSVKLHNKCRCCNSYRFTKYLDLGALPLVNNLANTKEEALSKDRFPLQIMFCEECGLSQLSVVVSPEKLFSYYTYRSGINGGYVKHCRKMAKTLKDKYNLSEKSFIIDIAGNDGSLLKQFKEEIGCDVLNIDPATNLAEIARSNGIPTWPVFWEYEVAQTLRLKGDYADMIVGTNVFAHVDDIKEFLEGVKIVLKHKGVLVLEFPYLIDFIENLEFDTTYHEHLSYMSLQPLYKLCSTLNLDIIDVEKQDIHGGTVRVIIGHKGVLPITPNVHHFLQEEKNAGFGEIERYKDWELSVNSLIHELTFSLRHIKAKNHKVAAFAASAKGNTLLNSAKITFDTIDYIVDQTPEKVGKFSPGTGIPIVDIDELIKNPPDYLIILAWNFKNEIMEKCRKLGYKGKFIIPIPKFEIIN